MFWEAELREHVRGYKIAAQEKFFPPQLTPIHTRRQPELLLTCTALPGLLESCQHLSWCQKVWVLRHKNNVGSDPAKVKYRKREWFLNVRFFFISLTQKTLGNNRILHHPKKWLQIKEKICAVTKCKFWLMLSVWKRWEGVQGVSCYSAASEKLFIADPQI